MLYQLLPTILFAVLAGCVVGNDIYCRGPWQETWYKFGDSCYHFHTGEKNYKSYYDAEDYCRSKGSHLASIHSEEENRFLQNTLRNHRSGYQRMWIGLNILEGPEKFQWSDGEPLQYDKIIPKKLYTKQSCFALYASDGGWRQDHCEMYYYPLCKRALSEVAPSPLPPLTPPPLPEGNCPESWIQFGHKCIKFFGAAEEERLTFHDAKKACNDLGENYDLISIHSMNEQAFLTQRLYDFGTSAWIGFNKIENDMIGHPLVFGWTDNSRVNFTYWDPRYKRVGFDDCVHLNVEGHGKGYWLPELCSFRKKGYICQRPPDASIPQEQPEALTCDGNESMKFRGSCYRYFLSEQSWDEAELTCKSHGSHLVSINDAFEQNFLYGFISPKNMPFWTGLRNVKNTRIFKWSSGEPLYYSNWEESHPDLSHVESSCVSTTISNFLQWNAETCDVKMPFICEKSEASPPPLPEDIVGSCPSFGSSWIDIGDDYCYHQGQGKYDKLRWGDNIRYCLSRGMEMISLHSKHQMDSLFSYLWKSSYDYWLSLIRNFDRDSFMWPDGSRVNFTNWADYEPGRSSQKDCVSVKMLDLKWNPTDCSDWKGNLCRIKKIPRGNSLF